MNKENILECWQNNPEELIPNIGDECFYKERKKIISHLKVGDTGTIHFLRRTPAGKKARPVTVIEQQSYEVYNTVYEYTPAERKECWTPTSNCPWGNVGIRRVG